MSKKKSLIASLIVGLVVTLALGIYTIVTVFTGNNPAKPKPVDHLFEYAYRTGDSGIDIFKDYAEDELQITLDEGTAQNPLQKNEDGTYDAVAVGGFKAVVNLNENGDTNTYVVKVYQQGTGATAEEPWIIANAKHLKELRDSWNIQKFAGLATEDAIPVYFEVKADIDLAGENWVAIGNINHPFTSKIIGNGHSVKNLTVALNAGNYKDFVVKNESNNAGYIDLGLFGYLNNAEISNLGFENADITVSDEVFAKLVHEFDEPTEEVEGVETVDYTAYARLTIGTLAGRADNTVVNGTADNKPMVQTTIRGFSFQQNVGGNNAYGIGGLFGVATKVNVDNYAFNVKVINSLVQPTAEADADGNTKFTNAHIGGVLGANRATDAESISNLTNLEVTFDADAIYSNNSDIGGLVGEANNVNIDSVNVLGFRVFDPTTYGTGSIKYPNRAEGERVTKVAGVSARVHAYIGSEITFKNINVTNLDVTMFGGDVAGVVVDAEYVTANAQQGTFKIVDCTVSGLLQGNDVAGIVWQLNPTASISYTKIANDPEVNVTLRGTTMAGIAVYAFGNITGFVTTPEGETPVEQRTRVVVKTVGMGYLPATNNNASFKYVRESSNVAGLVLTLGDAENTNVNPTLSGFEVTLENLAKYEGEDVGSVNYAGVSYQVYTATISNINVNMNVTSVHTGANVSTTYMVAGLVNLVNPGAIIENSNVTLELNKDVLASNKYAVAYVGGLVSRYVGDKEEKGMTLTGNKVTGYVYFNDMYHDVSFEVGHEEPAVYDRFGIAVVAGLVGAITDPGTSDLDAGLANLNINHTQIANNTVENFTIIADLKAEAERVLAQDKQYLNDQAYRYRALGATVGVAGISMTGENVLDLSTNVLDNVTIKTYIDAFKYGFARQGVADKTVILVNIAGYGDTNKYSYGVSLELNTSNAEAVTTITDVTAETTTIGGKTTDNNTPQQYESTFTKVVPEVEE